MKMQSATTMDSIKLVSVVCILNLIVAICESAPAATAKGSNDAAAEASKTSQLEAAHVEISKLQSDQPSVAPMPPVAADLVPAALVKLKRDSRAKLTSLELDTQETGHYMPAAYQTQDSDYGYDSGKNSYGKQASDWSLYDQGNHGLYDKYGDKAWNDQGHNQHSTHGKHDSYGNSYNSHGGGHGSGYYSRDRGYGYEKHYAYDKEVASKQHADSHNSYGSNHGLHDYYGNTGSTSHANHGHDKYGQASRYGNHGYGKRGSNLAAHHDYGHNANKAHYYAQSANPHYSGYSSHVPTYRSTYSDYSPQVGYPSSYPSYY